MAKVPSVRPKGQATRTRIVDTAGELFAKAGYQDTSIEDVLDKSGISRGALYHHFRDKEELFVAVLEAVEARIADATVKASVWSIYFLAYFLAEMRYWRADSGAKIATMATAHSSV